jgi:hypothetical protein
MCICNLVTRDVHSLEGAIQARICQDWGLLKVQGRHKSVQKTDKNRSILFRVCVCVYVCVLHLLS